MGQVPKSRLAILGNGRVSGHFQYFLQNTGISAPVWSRTSKLSLNEFVEDSQAETLLLLIKDSAIHSFIEENPSLQTKRMIHFSGCLTTPHATGMHPLMTFGPELYPEGFYETIPFVCEQERDRFEDVFPDFKNPVFYIPSEMKSFYHALCVLSGNFTVILWQKLFQEFESKLGIPANAALPYLEQVRKNLTNNPLQALTGPLQRKDQVTIEKNLAALKDDPFQSIYHAFLEMYQ